MKTKTICRACGQFLELIELSEGLRFSCPNKDCKFHIDPSKENT